MTTLQAIIERDQKLSFLVGSGVSVDPPSGLPTGYAFTKILLANLLPEELQTRIPRLLDLEVNDKRFLRFEKLMQLVQVFDADLRVLDPVGRCNRPNANHVALARLIRSGHSVFTTNFDSLVEYA